MQAFNLKERQQAFSNVHNCLWRIIGVLFVVAISIVGIPYITYKINLEIFKERQDQLVVLVNKMNSINTVIQRVNDDKATPMIMETRKNLDKILVNVREDSLKYPPECRQVLSIYKTTARFMAKIKASDTNKDKKELELQIRAAQKALSECSAGK